VYVLCAEGVDEVNLFRDSCYIHIMSIDAKTLNEFTRKVNRAHQQFCVWAYVNNKFVEYQETWNGAAIPRVLFKTEDFSRDKGCKYKNFWDVVITSLQHSWILSIARLFDPAYHGRDFKKNNPRLSLEYILELLDNEGLAKEIRVKLHSHKETIESLKNHRNNFIAHNDVHFTPTKVGADIKKIFEELERSISDIKNSDPRLKNCNNINREYTEALSRCGVDEVFEKLSEE
jgi:hypothetical protein